MTALFPGFRRTLADEYRRVIQPPWEIPTVLITNGTLMIAAWFLLPPRVHDFLFSLDGPLAFPVVLASWMLADTPATNAMGANPGLALSVLEHPTGYRRWLAARCIVLGSLIAIPSGIAVVFVGVGGGYSWSEVLWACVLLVLLPVGVLPIAAWLGIVFPFRLRTLRWRWQHRRAWVTQLRWAVLVLAPFVFVPLIGAAVLAPAIEVARSIKMPGQRLTEAQFGLVAALGCVAALLAAAIGLWGARPLLARRANRLTTYLSDNATG